MTYTRDVIDVNEACSHDNIVSTNCVKTVSHGSPKIYVCMEGWPKGDVMKRNSFLLCTPMNAQLYLNVVTRGLLDPLNS